MIKTLLVFTFPSFPLPPDFCFKLLFFVSLVALRFVLQTWFPLLIILSSLFKWKQCSALVLLPWLFHYWVCFLIYHLVGWILLSFSFKIFIYFIFSKGIINSSFSEFFHIQEYCLWLSCLSSLAGCPTLAYTRFFFLCYRHCPVNF